LGVGPDHPIGDLADYVLGPMSKANREIASQMALDAVDAVELILTDGPEKAMARFNRRNSPAETDEDE
jgi:peptidyl-tRNA hydrolase